MGSGQRVQDGDEAPAAGQETKGIGSLQEPVAVSADAHDRQRAALTVPVLATEEHAGMFRFCRRVPRVRMAGIAASGIHRA